MSENENEPPEPLIDNLDPGEALLEAQLAEPYMRGHEGIEKAQVGICAFLIALVGTLVYANSYTMPFLEDTKALFASGEPLQTVASASEGWDGILVRPLAALLLAVGWMLGDGGVLPFRILGVFLHLSNGVLVYLLARRLLAGKATEPIYALAGAIFIAHAGTTQAVYAPADMGSVLSTLFVLFSLVLYLRATASGEGLGTVSYGLSLCAFVAAWAAGLEGSVVPLFLCLVDAIVRRDVTLKNRASLLAPYWGLLCCMLVVQRWGGVDDAAAPERFLPVAGIIESLKVTFNPFMASVAHPIYEAQGLWWISLLLVVVTCALALLARGPGLFVAWYLLALCVPAMLSVSSSFQERSLYLPLVGLALFFPWLVLQFKDVKVRTGLGVVLFVVICANAGVTWKRTGIWTDETVLWVDARDKCDGCRSPSAHLGSRFLTMGEEALRQMQDAQIASDPVAITRHRERARELFERAAVQLESLVASEERPSSELWLKLGTAQRYTGKHNEAIASLKNAMKEDPLNQRAVMESAVAVETKALSSGRPEDSRRAIEYYQRASELGSVRPEIALRHALLLMRMGDAERSGAMLQGLVDRGMQEPAVSALSRVTATVRNLQGIRAQLSQIPPAEMGGVQSVVLRSQELYFQGNYLQASYMIDTLRRQYTEIPPELWLVLGVCKGKMNSLDQFFLDWPNGPDGRGGQEVELQLARLMASTAAWDSAQEILVHRASMSVAELEKPEYTLSEIALELGDAQRATFYLNQVVQGDPDDAEPWLRLAELAAKGEQRSLVLRYLNEAQTRGASDERLKNVRERAGISDSERVINRIQ